MGLFDGIKIDEMWGNVTKSAEQAIGDLWRNASSSVPAYIEGQAISILEADKKKHEAEFQRNAAEILARPTSADSFSAYISNQLQSPVIKQYGAPILIAIVAIGITAIMMSRK